MKGNVEVSVFGEGEYISFVGLSEIKVFLECRNAEGSVFGDGGVFLLQGYLELQTFQNAGMKEQILNCRLLEFGMEFIF